MLKSHEKFHSVNGKRQILIADDELINREMLGNLLNSDYELIFAVDGQDALEKIRENGETLSLILLDLLMPRLNGLEVLQQVKKDPALQYIPIIVITSDQRSEIESLTLGASDFIPKPYPQPGVIQARILRTIELSEDRQIINSTERDPLTGLYNREYFYRYAEQFDHYHKDTDMDAIVVDVYHFRMINERFGADYGDEVLRRIGGRVREMVQDTGGIVCRSEADTFLVYCPHGKDYKAIMENASIGLAGEESVNNRVRLRMGVYVNADKSLDIERRFDRAKMAADTVRSSFSNNIGFYDSRMHEKELYAEQLIEDFHKAIEEKQFSVFYQPKFDVRQDIPVLAGAEALVRWQHPEIGMISPGFFIPLFESNGLIQTLDRYVWREAAARIREWKERFGIVVPVSVNVSRVDMYEPDLIDVFRSILDENGLTPNELLLEITESAYTQDSEQIVEVVNSLRTLGFHIEMDDFGTGYSSLNMISTLPIDALKLDMQFIRNAFSRKRDTKLLEVIIDIADYLAVPVIAEGVETEEQLNALKAMGCDMVQGYYFSKPVPPEGYERFVAERKRLEDERKLAEVKSRARESGEVCLGKIAHALTSGYESIYYVDVETGNYVEFSAAGRYEDLQIERSGVDFFADTERNIPRVVCREDRTRVALSMKKETLLEQIAGARSFSMTYRLMIDGTPVFYNLKAMRAGSHDDHHIVIGISNIDDRMTHSGGEEQPDALDFGSLAQALSGDVESIYYVDTATGAYTEFKTDGRYGKLRLEISGSDFFGDCRKNIKEAVYIEDRKKVETAMSKQTLLAALRERCVFSMIYRLTIGGRPMYYRLKAVQPLQRDDSHIIIGVSNIDESITEDEKREFERRNSVTFAGIAQALAMDYFSIYYVDTETDRFIEYSSHEEYSELNIEKGGEDFFELSRRNICRVVHRDDVDMFLKVFTKENLLAELAHNMTFTMTYRLMMGGKPTYVAMKVTRMADENDKHIVIGVSNINAEMERRRAAVTYENIAKALAMDYFSIHYVDTDTDEFIEYSSHEEYRKLNLEKGGSDFFNLSRRNILKVVHPDDVDMFLKVFTKENLLAELAHSTTFTMTYRLMFGESPTYVHMKATRLEDENDSHIVIGVSNIDDQIRREQEHMRVLHMANRDPLTGVKSKHAFAEAEREIDQEIGRGVKEAFAVAVCDVNGLKHINDTLGHKAGDQYIKDACKVICNVFRHSPVFRMGGDEFAVILNGEDYGIRGELLRMMTERSRGVEIGEGVIIACGLSEYRKGEDASLSAVFERADVMMYDNKKMLKGARL